MKSTGIVRRIDDLGRVVIPKEQRRTLGVENGDPLEFFVNGEQIILRKYRSGCFICGNQDAPMHLFHGKEICIDCVRKAADLLQKDGSDQ